MGAVPPWAESGLSAFGEGNGKADHDLKLRFEANVFRRKPRGFGIILVHNHLIGRHGDAANAFLAAVGYNFLRLIAWLAALAVSAPHRQPQIGSTR
jgi:hypothetical protein